MILLFINKDSYGIQEIHTSCNFVQVVALHMHFVYRQCFGAVFWCSVLVQCYGVCVNVHSGCPKAFAWLISAYCKRVFYTFSFHLW